MPVPKKQQGKPLGGIGAQAMRPITHGLVLDDRLLSKQYITAKLDDRVSDDAYGGSWDGVTNKAPSKNAIYDKISTFTADASQWSWETADNAASKIRAYTTGNYGIGSGANMAYSDITHKLTVDGDLRVGAVDASSKDVYLDDGAILYKYGSGGSTAMLTLNSSSGHKLGQSLAIGTANPTAPLEIQLSGTATTAADGTGKFQIGADSSANMGIDHDKIQARDGSGSGATLYLNYHGGGITTGSSGSSFEHRGNMTVVGNLTVQGTATSIETTNVTTSDNIIVLNNDVTGTPSENAGIEVERGSSDNVAIRWNESTDKWQITEDGSSYANILTGTGSLHDAVTLVDGSSTGLLSLSTQAITINDVMVKNSGDTMTGTLTCSGTSGSSGTTALSVTGGNSASSNAAVSITGHLEATTKSFNIPHPLLENKRLVYGSLEGPEHGMYARGSFSVEDKRRRVAVDLPKYWFKMVFKDYTVNLTSYGNYNVWINGKDENGFWVETNAEDEWSFDWIVIGGRTDAKLEVEPDA